MGRLSAQRLGIVDRLDRRLGSVVSTESRHSGHRLGGSFGSIGHTRLSRHAGELYNFDSHYAKLLRFTLKSCGVLLFCSPV